MMKKKKPYNPGNEAAVLAKRESLHVEMGEKAKKAKFVYGPNDFNPNVHSNWLAG